MPTLCFSFWVWYKLSCFLSLGNDQETPQVEAEREKIVSEMVGGDGAEGGSTCEGDAAEEEEGEAYEEEEGEDEDGSMFETETEVETETETTETETDEDGGEKLNR